MTRRRLQIGLLTCVLTLPAAALADGLLLQGSNDFLPETTDVSAQIQGQVATTEVTWRFDVPSGDAYKLVFAVPEAASVVGLAVDAGAGWRDASISREDAADNSSVGAGGGNNRPDVRNWLGANGLNVNVPAPQSGKPLLVRLSYIEILPYDFGEVRYRYPLGTPSPGQIERLTLEIELSTFRRLGTVQMQAFPGNRVDDQGTSNGRRQVYEATRVRPTEDFSLVYSVQQDGLFTHVLTHHESCDEDGYFLLLVEPEQDVAEGDIVAKYFTFVIDTSGSMEGDKLAQAKAAAEFFIENLNPDDQFNIVQFSSDVSTFFRSPVRTTNENRRNAISTLRGLWAGGGTNLFGGLERALDESFDGNLARNVVLLTDGQPTEGRTSTDDILRGLRDANTSDSRIFTFGIGNADASLLRAIAAENGGRSELLTGDDFSGLLTDFFLRINRPVLTDVTLDFGTDVVHEVFPNDTTDLYAGAQLLVIGRFRAGADTRGELRGRFEGARQRHPFTFRLPDCNPDENAFLPRLWAKGKIDALLDRIAREGREDPVLVGQIEALALKYGIQTPYTSFGVPNDAAQPGNGSRPGSYDNARSPRPSNRDRGSSGGGSSGGSSGGYSWGGPEDEHSGCNAAPSSGAPLLLLALLAGLRRRRQ